MTTAAIRIESVSKKYLIGAAEPAATTFVEALGSILTAPVRRFRALSQKAKSSAEEFWALREVSFDVAEGEVVGIIGHNGAGKSTLLKILSRITEPTGGRIEIRGRVASLLEVGTGFHPELTGRENIFLNGSILGMTKREIRSKLDAIIEFSGIEQFLDTPFKRYSSGMGVRLAFAVAAHLDPEILIIDEVLAVGDAEFQKKCLGKMSEVADGGRTVLFVSHNMSAVQTLCQRSILLQQGRVMADGNCREVVDRYLSDLGGDRTSGAELPPIRGLHLKVDVRGSEGDLCRPGEPVTFQLDFETETPLNDARVGIGIDDFRGYRLTTLYTYFQMSERVAFRRRASLQARWESVNLAPGTYWLTIAVSEAGQNIAHWERSVSFNVSVGDFYGTGRLPTPNTQGCLLTPIQWTVEGD